MRGIPQPYYTEEVAWRFITEIEAALAARGFRMVYKKKRELGRTTAARFRTGLERLYGQKRVVPVDPDAAPQRLILEAAGVISMPFTSTALIARAMGKPTVYYDPLGVLVDEHRLAHGIEVIGTMADLRNWLAALQPPAAQVLKEAAVPAIEHTAGLPVRS
jgi:polysaccharide biosynthesis PFTS motif protein